MSTLYVFKHRGKTVITTTEQYARLTLPIEWREFIAGDKTRLPSSEWAHVKATLRALGAACEWYERVEQGSTAKTALIVFKRPMVREDTPSANLIPVELGY